MTNVGIIYNEQLNYPDFPYNPCKIYPEIKYKYTPQSSNIIYDEMRTLFCKLGYDKVNFNTKNWNPLGFLIKKGEKVLIKPNLVFDSEKSPFCIITHPSVIRFLIDYSYIATGDSGEIIVGDAPQMNADWNKLMKLTELDKTIEIMKKQGIPVKLIDFRLEIVKKKKIWSERTININGNNSSIIVDLKEDSLLYELEKSNRRNFYGADYNREIVNNNHNIHRNTYCITKALLDSDVVISVPKLKTHKKAGITLNLKNFVGINVHKNYLPHYRIGCPNQHGDAFPNMNSFLNSSRYLLYIFRDLFLKSYQSRFARFFHNLLSLRGFLEYFIIKLFFPNYYTHYFKTIDGDWNGNDTIWRMVLDLNIILRYADNKGLLRSKQQRKVFSVIDGIIAGDKDGPLDPNPRNVGVIIMGENHIAVDLVAIKLMGFDYSKIPLMKNLFLLKKFPLIDENQTQEIEIITNIENLNGINIKDLKLNLNFVPPLGWKNFFYIKNKHL